MKKVVKAAALFPILVLYCFIVSLYSTGISASGIKFQNDQSTKEGSYFPIGGNYLLYHTTKTENVVNGFKNLLTFSFKNHTNDFLAHRKAAESYLFNTYSEYIFFAKNLVVKLQQTDIIFPFHYFW